MHPRPAAATAVEESSSAANDAGWVSWLGSHSGSIRLVFKMPRISARRRMLIDIRECMKYAILFQAVYDSSSSDFDTSDDEVDELNGDSDSESLDSSLSDGFEDVLNIINLTYLALQESRYIMDRINAPRSTEFMFNYFYDLTPLDFRAITRMNRENFDFVVDLIKDDPIFHNESDYQQAPVHWQVACALDRLGNDGQGVSAARSKVIMCIGHGTVFSYYKRVVHALCNHRYSFLQWPDARERLEISLHMESKGFRGAVGFVDGTTFPLSQKPSYHGNDYLDRKKRYSIQAQVVCDSRFQIRHFLSGPPGSCHDSRVFSFSPLVTNPLRFFSAGEFLISDSAYASSEHLVPAYRRRQRDDVQDDMELQLIERFNTYLAQARVVNENTIGILKSRWSSLRGLRLQLRKRGDIIHVIKHTVACAILHNIALEKDPWEDELVILDEPDDGVEAQVHGEVGRQNPGQRKRLQVRRACLAFFDGQESDGDA